jgi:penicillin-binding protein 2
MYDLLTPEAREMITREAFENRYRNVLAEATVYEFATEVGGDEITNLGEAAVDFNLLYRTHLLGDLPMRPRLTLVLNDDNEWEIAWTPAAIIPELGDTNRLRLFGNTPTRGPIVDRNGELMATGSTIVTIGVVQAWILDEAMVHEVIGEATGLSPEEIAARYAGQPESWFIPVVDITYEQSRVSYDRLTRTSGIQLRESAVRSYPHGALASHIVGFVGPITAEELTAAPERGLDETDVTGKAGIEYWGEETLAGRKGGRLAVITPEGNEVATLAEAEPTSSRALRLTIDLHLQRACEEALGGRRGSIVVADIATGKILAMASAPAYDPNVMANPLFADQRMGLVEAPEQPFLNRATQGAYPAGSLFKVITMAAALELANVPPSNPHFCSGVWTGLGFPMGCWREEGHGNIDLYHGLEQSCNVVFYETGMHLHSVGETLLQDMAGRFGVGSPTGVEVFESQGLLPTSQWKREALNDVWVPGDSVNLAIGQGFLQVTAAQMTRALVAVANGGTLHELSIVERAEDPTGAAEPEYFERAEAPRVELRPEVLETIRASMRAVAIPPMGTASDVFGDFPLPVAGKTGTAESAPGQEPHAWFGGYAPFEQPQIAFVGMIEQGGAGSEVAAPMIRQVLERHFAPPQL